MAITANTVWEFQTGGNDANGGGFDATILNHGTDYSQSTSPRATLTASSVVNATTTKITVAAGDYTVDASDVGNIYANLGGGSSTAGFYQITAVDTGANTWTLDRSIGTAGQTCIGRMGGCRINLDSNSFGSALVAGNTVYIKSGTYTGSGTTTLVTGSQTAPITLIGYKTTRGDNPTATADQPLLARGANTFNIGAFKIFKYISISQTNLTRVVENGGYGIFISCFFSSNTGSTNGTISLSVGLDVFINCDFTNPSGRCVIGAGTAVLFYSCYFHDSAVGNIATQGAKYLFCLFKNISSSCIGNTQIGVSNCTFYGAETPAGTAITIGDSQQAFTNNNIYGFTTAITNGASGINANYLANNNIYNCTTAYGGTQQAGINDTALDPQFTNAAGGDFSIGTNLKAKGWPGTFGGLTTTTGYTDIGAVQRQEPAAGATGASFTWGS